MNQDENYTQLEQRITELENQVKTLSQLLPLVEQISTLEKIQNNFTLIEDVDRYTPLRDLLAAGDFKRADRETARVLLEKSGEDRDSLTPDDVRKFSCNTIRVIDRLWRNYSQDRFGFSIQIQIYLEEGGTRESLIAQDINQLIKFGDRVGWRINNQWQTGTYDQWDFSVTAPKGCFPAIWWSSPYGAKMVNFFFVRLLECKI